MDLSVFGNALAIPPPSPISIQQVAIPEGSDVMATTRRGAFLSSLVPVASVFLIAAGAGLLTWLTLARAQRTDAGYVLRIAPTYAQHIASAEVARIGKEPQPVQFEMAAHGYVIPAGLIRQYAPLEVLLSLGDVENRRMWNGYLSFYPNTAPPHSDPGR